MRFLLSFFFIIVYSLYGSEAVNLQNVKTSQKLFGPWEYQLIQSNDIQDTNYTKQSTLLPSFVESNVGTNKGAVVFTLELNTTKNQPLSLDLSQSFSVWKAYANDKLIGSSGELNIEKGIYKAHADYPIISFIPKEEKTTLKIVLANAEHSHLGFYGVPKIAPTGILEKQKVHNINIQLMVVAILFSFAIYHLGLFIAWRKDKAPLWFGFLSLSLSIRASSTGDIVLLQFFPDIAWEVLCRISYTSGYIALPLFVLYIGSLYPKQTNRFAENLYLSIGLLFISFSLFTSTEFFTSTLVVYELIVVTFIVYTLVILFKSYRTKEKGSFLAFGAFIIFSVTIIHDLLMFQNILKDSVDLLPYGFIFYLLAQAMILLLRYANTFEALELHKNNLEDLVAKETLELQNLTEQQKLLLKELTHRVKNNLQLILGLLRIQKKEVNEETQSNLKNFEMQIKAISFVHESLSAQSDIDTIEINRYLSNLIESLKKLYPQLNIYFESQTEIYIKPDYAISLGLILNELVTNYLKYSNKDFISLKTYQKESKILIQYHDGINLESAYQKANENNFGLPKLGWSMIKNFLKQIDASIIFFPNYLEIALDVYKEQNETTNC